MIEVMENPQVLQVSVAPWPVEFWQLGLFAFHLGLCRDSWFPSIPLVLVGMFLESGWWMLAPTVDLLHCGSPSKDKILFLGFRVFSITYRNHSSVQQWEA